MLTRKPYGTDSATATLVRGTWKILVPAGNRDAAGAVVPHW